ncbi:hypothetical protein FQA47_015111 [Oryzias melastigma]|uniref:Uncharacterized protein n=1 Tax=Oryzias melastigma TaxID=30732 RepID=A0A834C0V0_ORYME|nr:hypothetical protein FQA47_015111 [Oryzias melastigma]
MATRNTALRRPLLLMTFSAFLQQEDQHKQTWRTACGKPRPPQQSFEKSVSTKQEPNVPQEKADECSAPETVFHRRVVQVIRKAPGVPSMSGSPRQGALRGAA